MRSTALLLLIILLQAGCSIYSQDIQVNSCSIDGEYVNPNFSKAAKIQAELERLVKSGVPGVNIAVYSSEGWWTSAAGYAKVENKTPMQACHLMYLQSVAKTYMAVAILKLYEQGKIDIEKSIVEYLPESISKMITSADRITVKMLLNHTSGVPEYNYLPAYVTKLLQDQNHFFQPIEYIKYIDGKPLDFEPGTKYSYRNSNFVLLSLIGDHVTGNHAKYMSEQIFQPLGLSHTFYRSEPGYLNYPEIVNGYWDRYSDGIVENTSGIQRNNVQAMVGDDGIVASPVDAVKFLRGLMEGQLLSSSTLDLMKTWVNDSKGNPEYGLGLDRAKFLDEVGYGHSGGGIAAGCQLYYIPKFNLYFFVGINLGTVTDSPLHKQAEPIVDRLYKAMFD